MGLIREQATPYNSGYPELCKDGSEALEVLLLKVRLFVVHTFLKPLAPASREVWFPVILRGLVSSYFSQRARSDDLSRSYLALKVAWLVCELVLRMVEWRSWTLLFTYYVACIFVSFAFEEIAFQLAWPIILSQVLIFEWGGRCTSCRLSSEFPIHFFSRAGCHLWSLKGMYFAVTLEEKKWKAVLS